MPEIIYTPSGIIDILNNSVTIPQELNIINIKGTYEKNTDKLYAGQFYDSLVDETGGSKLTIKVTLNLVKKHFSVYSDFSPYPDYIKTKKIFIQEIESNFKRIMAWGITYSRLNVEEKTELLKKYYSNNLIFTFKKVAERMNSVELLKFILSQKDIEEDDSVHILEEKNDIVNENMSSGSYNDVPF